jgi:hypothetical protein
MPENAQAQQTRSIMLSSGYDEPDFRKQSFYVPCPDEVNKSKNAVTP